MLFLGSFIFTIFHCQPQLHGTPGDRRGMMLVVAVANNPATIAAQTQTTSASDPSHHSDKVLNLRLKLWFKIEAYCFIPREQNREAKKRTVSELL
jgi:hypothetical protein